MELVTVQGREGYEQDIRATLDGIPQDILVRLPPQRWPRDSAAHAAFSPQRRSDCARPGEAAQRHAERQSLHCALHPWHGAAMKSGSVSHRAGPSLLACPAEAVCHPADQGPGSPL